MSLAFIRTLYAVGREIKDERDKLGAWIVVVRGHPSSGEFPQLVVNEL